MPSVNCAPFGPKPQFMLTTGVPAVGYKLFFYVAGSVNTKQNTYTDSTGTSANTNPLVLNSLGEPTTEIWFTSGQAYKAVLAPSTDTDPPSSPVWTIDNLRGINDTSVTIDQWVSGPAPTYINATQFSLVGDQTSTFHVGRRIKATVTAGTVYGRITTSAFAAVTTVTVVLDSGNLDSGLSAVSYGLLTSVNPSSPVLDDNAFLVSGSGDKTKLVRFEVDGLTTATTRSIRVQDSAINLANASNATNEFRLTLTSGLPVTTSDVTAAGTLYCTPFRGNQIDLYDGTNWNRRTSAEFSLALTLTSGKPYDVFVYDNAGVPMLEVLVWTNDTTRATALSTQDGVLVKSGAATRRYVGTLYASGANTTEDSIAKRYLWNYYNRVNRTMRVVDATASWNYSTATFRQARATATNQLDYVQGVSEDPVYARVDVNVSNDNASAVLAGPGIGVDSTTVNSAQKMVPGQTGPTANQRTPMMAEYHGWPGVGRHTLVWGEYATATGVTTWYGTQSPTNISGITGHLPG